MEGVLNHMVKKKLIPSVEKENGCYLQVGVGEGIYMHLGKKEAGGDDQPTTERPYPIKRC